MQTITVTIEGSDLHLISYYTSEDIRSGVLKVSFGKQSLSEHLILTSPVSAQPPGRIS
jgi:hypothetical protein